MLTQSWWLFASTFIPAFYLYLWLACNDFVAFRNCSGSLRAELPFLLYYIAFNIFMEIFPSSLHMFQNSREKSILLREYVLLLLIDHPKLAVSICYDSSSTFFIFVLIRSGSRVFYSPRPRKELRQLALY